MIEGQTPALGLTITKDVESCKLLGRGYCHGGL